jgi:hypothetical protein
VNVQGGKIRHPAVAAALARQAPPEGAAR